MRSLLWLLGLLSLTCRPSLVSDAGASPPGEFMAPIDAGPPAACVDLKRTFERTVWSSFMGSDCLGCHSSDGSAAERGATFLLRRDSEPDFINLNMQSVAQMARLSVDDEPYLLAKAQGLSQHGGGAILEAQSQKFAALRDYLNLLRQNRPACERSATNALLTAPLLSPSQTLRKAYLGLAGTLPPSSVSATVTEASLADALQPLFATDGFDGWLRDLWNDQLLVRKGLFYGVPGTMDIRTEDFRRVYYYNTTAYQSVPEEYWSLVNGIVEQPLRLISYIVKENRPFTEVLTANYTVMSPALMDLFGVPGGGRVSYVTLDQWQRVDKVTARAGTDGQIDVPLAGILTTPGFLGRYPATPTNRSRARARVLYRLFLGVDLFSFSKRELDTSALTSVINPETNSSACSVCHKVMDPVAGIFRGYEEETNGYYSFSFEPRRAWHPEMRLPGVGTKMMPPEAYQAAAQWGAREIAQDPRFALAIVKSAFRAVTGVPVLPYPANSVDDPSFEDELEAWNLQDDYLQALAEAFRQNGHSYRWLLTRLVQGPFFRGTGVIDNRRLSQVTGFGRPLAPEKLSRKIRTLTGVHFGQGWYAHFSRGEIPFDGLTFQYPVQAGGIDSLNVTHRSSDIGPLRAALLQRMAAFVACYATAFDFTKPPSERVLFPNVQEGQTPLREDAGVWSVNPEGEAAVRQGLVALHERLLGEQLTPEAPQIENSLKLFKDVYQTLAASGDSSLVCNAVYDWSKPLRDTNGQVIQQANPLLPVERRIGYDRTYTIRSWQAVVQYLLNEPAFFME